MKVTCGILPVAVLAGALMAVSAPACAGSSFAESGTGRKIALGAGSGAASLVYTPAKCAYAAVTTIAGGLVYVCSGGQDLSTAAQTVEYGTRGDWWVHPDVLTCHRSLQFTGPY